MADKVAVFDADVAEEMLVQAGKPAGRGAILLPSVVSAHKDIAPFDERVDLFSNVHAEGEFKVPSGVVVSRHGVFSFLGWMAFCRLKLMTQLKTV